MTEKLPNGLTYAQAGVDIDAGNALVDDIKPLVRATAAAGRRRAKSAASAGCSTSRPRASSDPILVAATDGVGTKLKIAIDTGMHDTIGIDLVAMCVNDIVVQGAEPLFFLDYFATGKLDVEIGAAIVAGIAEGCRQAGCALIGGETAEMPGMYRAQATTISPALPSAPPSADQLLPTADVAAGDVLIGLASSGVHSNGYSLVRRIVDASGLGLGSTPAPFAPAQTLGEALLDADAHLREAAARSHPRARRRHQGAGAHHRRRLPRQHSARAARRLRRAARS